MFTQTENNWKTTELSRAVLSGFLNDEAKNDFQNGKTPHMGHLCWCEDRSCYEYSEEKGLEIKSSLDVPYHAVMLRPDDCDPNSILKNFAEVLRLIPQDAILEDHPHHRNAPDGREFSPHVTILYGLEDEKDLKPISSYLKNEDAIEFTIGEISTFRVPNKPYDVLKIAVHSAPMERLHYWLKANFQNKCQFLYSAHLTLAYIKKGTCSEVEGPCWWTGTKYTGHSLAFSHRTKGITVMPLYPLKGAKEGQSSERTKAGRAC